MYIYIYYVYIYIYGSKRAFTPNSEIKAILNTVVVVMNYSRNQCEQKQERKRFKHNAEIAKSDCSPACSLEFCRPLPGPGAQTRIPWTASKASGPLLDSASRVDVASLFKEASGDVGFKDGNLRYGHDAGSATVMETSTSEGHLHKPLDSSI